MVGALLASQLLSPVSTLAAEYELLDEKPAVAEVAVNNTLTGLSFLLMEILSLKWLLTGIPQKNSKMPKFGFQLRKI